MLDRLLHRVPKVGDRATVRRGPYAGRTGTITSVAGDPARYQVTIDDCCQAEVTADGLVVARRSFFGAMNRAAERREHSAMGGYARDPFLAASVMVSQLREGAEHDQRASSVARDIADRALERRQSGEEDPAG